jgi:hypothetical protein
MAQMPAYFMNHAKYNTNARDGKAFTASEQQSYNHGHAVGTHRRKKLEFMGTAKNSGWRGRQRLIFNEGLEDGYSGIGV